MEFVAGFCLGLVTFPVLVYAVLMLGVVLMSDAPSREIQVHEVHEWRPDAASTPRLRRAK